MPRHPTSGLVVSELAECYKETYIVLEDLNFGWNPEHVQEFERMWRGGFAIEDIAKTFNRDIDEVALLVIDRARKDKIFPRKNGVFGSRRYEGA